MASRVRGTNPLQALLDLHGAVILDGALATELERRGCDLNDPLWSARVLIDAPHLIREVHSDYMAAGADVVTTATYQATVEGFARRGLGRAEAERLMLRAVDLAREARDAFWADAAARRGRSRPLVAASIGPYGAFLADGSEYSGDYGLSEEELSRFHRDRLNLLAASGADLLACETIPALVEARSLALLMEDAPIGGWVSFSARDGRHTSHGERLSECAAVLDSFDSVYAVGVNCTDPRYISDAVAALRSGTGKPILVYPNSGERYVVEGRTWSGSAFDLADSAVTWRLNGAPIIGGCCRTTPEQIARLAGVLRAGSAE